MPAKKKNTNDAFDQFDAQPAFDSSEAEVATIDFSDVPDEIEYEVWPTGIYDGIVEDVEYKISSKGNPMLTWTINMTNEDKSSKGFYHTTLNGNGLVRAKKAIQNLLPYAPGQEFFDPSEFNPVKAKEVFVGTECRVRLAIEPYNGVQRNSVKEVMPPSESADNFLS